MLQPWVVFATGSAVIHLTYTSPVSGSTSIPLGTVLQKDWVSAMPFCARTSSEGPKVCPPSFEAVTLIWLAEKSRSGLHLLPRFFRQPNQRDGLQPWLAHPRSLSGCPCAHRHDRKQLLLQSC